MTDLEKKKTFLSRYLAMDRSIDLCCEELSVWRARATKITSTLSDMPKGGGVQDPIQTAIGHIIDLEEEINREIDAMLAVREEIRAAISGIQDGAFRSILEYRYICGLSWKDICEKIYGLRDDYAEKYDSYLRSIYRWHKGAVDAMSLNVTS